jgi:hypothetical protein
MLTLVRMPKNTSDESILYSRPLKCLCRIPLCHFRGEGVNIFYVT